MGACSSCCVGKLHGHNSDSCHPFQPIHIIFPWARWPTLSLTIAYLVSSFFFFFLWLLINSLFLLFDLLWLRLSMIGTQLDSTHFSLINHSPHNHQQLLSISWIDSAYLGHIVNPTDRTRNGLYEPLLQENEREAVADLLQFLESKFLSMDHQTWRLLNWFGSKRDSTLLAEERKKLLLLLYNSRRCLLKLGTNEQ